MITNTYTESNVQELVDDIFSSDAVVGFNIIILIIKYCKVTRTENFSTVNSIDMMKLVQKPLGFRPKLDNLTSSTLGATKTANGLQSLIWFKERKINKIMEYCYNDVKLTKELYEHGRDKGYIFAQSRGELVKVYINW